MRDKFVIFIVATIIIFLLGLIAHIQYFQTKDNLIRLYSQKQLMLAEQAAITLESFIKERIKAIELIVDLNAKMGESERKYLSDMMRTYYFIKGFEHIFYSDTNGLSIDGYPKDFPCPAKQPTEIKKNFLSSLHKAGATGEPQVFAKNVLVDGHVFVCLICPVYTADNVFNGAIVGVVNIKESLNKVLQPIVIDSNDHAWIVNEPGYLIYHPFHEKILIQNLFQPDSSCFEYHRNFDFEKNIFKNKNGVIINENITKSKQLIGFAHVNLENTKWTIAISTSFENITKALRSEFANFLLLIIFIILTILTGAVLFNRINSKHITTKKELEGLKVQTALIKEKKEAESRYRILVEQSPDPIFVCTRKKILMVNKSYSDLFGYSPGEIVGKEFNLTNLVIADKKESLEKKFCAYVKGKHPTLSVSTVMQSRSGDPLIVEISISRIRLRTIIVYQGIIHDVTRTRQLEREREKRKNLAMIGEMAARIAHEIKNPLASIQTGIQLLESQVVNDENQKNYFQRLKAEIQRVDNILKGLLTFAREEHINKKPVPIAPLVIRFRQLLDPTLKKHNLNLVVRMDENISKINADEQKLEQVLWNICLNAIQASESGSEISLSVHEQKDEICLEVVDSGFGIPMNIMNKIFQPFFSTRVHGSGLGLAISKKIIEQHGGKLTIQSKEQEGTTVSICLPNDERSA